MLRLALDRESQALPRARGELAGFLAGALPDQVRADVVLAATELLTNALLHAPPGPITLTANLGAEQLRVEVADPGPGLPADWRGPSRRGIGGWGLQLVAALSDRWGHTGTRRAWSGSRWTGFAAAGARPSRRSRGCRRPWALYLDLEPRPPHRFEHASEQGSPGLNGQSGPHRVALPCSGAGRRPPRTRTPPPEERRPYDPRVPDVWTLTARACSTPIASGRCRRSR